MRRRIGLGATFVLLTSAGIAAAQTQPRLPGPRLPAGPNQPMTQRLPTIQRRPPVQQPPPPPFQLTRPQEAYLDRVLQAWQQRSEGVKTFACKFSRWEYDEVFGPADTHRYLDEGQIKYASPDKGSFRVQTTEKSGNMVRIEPQRQEHWICDGRSVYEFNYVKKQLIQHKLPPELRGKAISDGPLPFLFGANAAALKQRYFMRIVTPQNVQNQQIWLEAYPRSQQDAANFKRAELILTIKDMMPHALQIHSLNDKNRTVYQFHKIVVNDPLWFVKGNPFVALTPLSWEKIVEEAPASRVSRQPAPGGRR